MPRVKQSDQIYHYLNVLLLFYLRLCETTSIQQKQGHYCGYRKGPVSFPARPHFPAGKTICTTDAESPATLCQNTTGSLSDVALS